MNSPAGSARASGSSSSQMSGAACTRAYSLTGRTVAHDETSSARMRSRIEKKRSYTTSILVSPHPDRKLLLPQKQRSMEERKPISICSGDVTVDVAKDQFYLPSISDDCVRASADREELLIDLFHRLNATGNEPKNNRTMVNPEPNSNGSNPCVQSTRTPLFQGADASYI
ncbi:unnamed protein product [Gongylonema pulchrum]|uniref:Uncharacterized protein n=1 Tax=Gongylonema pulchrum TaxID=637853 RepID=A0A3P6Q8K9_9BILA|nr:unnamed protein product [Gongylonema pulchrum]